MSSHDADFVPAAGRSALDLRRSGGAGEALPILRLGTGTTQGSQRAGWALVAMLLLFAVAHVLVRGPVDLKGNVNLCDFASHYASSRLWLIGGDPYDSALLPLVWQASWPGAFDVPLDYWWGLLPPGAYVLLAPLAALPAWEAALLWLVLSCASVWASIAATMAIANIRAATLTAALVLAAALAGAPFQTLLAVGQASLPAIALILLSLACATRGRDVWAGALLGLAGCLKPQLAAPFVVYFLAFRNWRLVGWATLCGAGVNLVGIAQLEWRSIAWLSTWTANIAASTAALQANDATLSGPWRHQIVNLAVLLYGFVESKTLVSLLNWTIASTMIGAFAVLMRRGRLAATSLLPLSVLCALSILPLYHRSYDAAILIVPLAWALLSLRRGAGAGGGVRTAAGVTLVAMSVFLVPFDALVLAEQKLGWFAGISQTWAWRVLVAQHHAWALLAVCTCMIGALYLRVRQLGHVYGTEDDAADTIQLHAYQRADETASRWRTARRTG